MPRFHLASTLLLLLLSSIVSASHPLALELALPSLPTRRTLQHTMTDGNRSNTYAKTYLSKYIFYNDDSERNSGIEMISDSVDTFCGNCSFKRTTFPVLPPRKYGLDMSPWGWQSDGALPFYRVRSDIQRSPDKAITILGLFELSTAAGERAEGRSELAAALMAIKHVNQRRLLGDYQLRILTNDTKSNTGIVIESPGLLIRSKPLIKTPIPMAYLGTDLGKR
ncbi:Receptor ligand binding region [Homalodisca vitripennis]|nr:Receptor ligand binding region [Homalodisca vitripennis]